MPDFDYMVNYKDASWATILENRIRLVHKLLSDTGSIFVRCDYNGNFIVRCLLDDIFGKENFRNEIQVSRISTQKFFEGIQRFLSFWLLTHLFWYSKTEQCHIKISTDWIEKIMKKEWHSMDSQSGQERKPPGRPLIILGELKFIHLKG